MWHEKLWNVGTEYCHLEEQIFNILCGPKNGNKMYCSKVFISDMFFGQVQKVSVKVWKWSKSLFQFFKELEKTFLFFKIYFIVFENVYRPQKQHLLHIRKFLCYRRQGKSYNIVYRFFWENNYWAIYPKSPTKVMILKLIMDD